ncbi:TIM-barrel domain-containing protein [Escherichia coli]
MIRRLKAKGLKICVWINPYIGEKSPVFKELQEKGYLLKRPDGSLIRQWDTAARSARFMTLPIRMPANGTPTN